MQVGFWEGGWRGIHIPPHGAPFHLPLFVFFVKNPSTPAQIRTYIFCLSLPRPAPRGGKHRKIWKEKKTPRRDILHGYGKKDPQNQKSFNTKKKKRKYSLPRAEETKSTRKKRNVYALSPPRARRSLFLFSAMKTKRRTYAGEESQIAIQTNAFSPFLALSILINLFLRGGWGLGEGRRQKE